MKVVIFAGGLGSRISEESQLKPKPMIEIGGKPILWHIMKIYQSHGFSEFIVCLGYKGYVIKEYFANYFLHSSDVTFNLEKNKMTIHKNHVESFKVTLVDTGLNTLTAGRLKAVESYLDNDEHFMLTYGDGVSNVDITDLINFHKAHNKLCTVTAIQPSGKFGVLDIRNNDIVGGFEEKPKSEGTWINGGFFVLNRKIFDFLKGSLEDQMWEQEPMKALVSKGELVAYKHSGFWKSMDILRDKMELEQLWRDNPKWRTWK